MTIAFIPEALPITETSTPPEPLQPADSTSEKILEDRIVAAINALVDEADAQKSAAVLVDVLTWTLARMILRVDSPWGAGDVMCRIGKYVCSLQHRKEAQKEAHSERTDIDSQRDRELAANAQDLRKLRVAIPLSVSRNPG